MTKRTLALLMGFSFLVNASPSYADVAAHWEFTPGANFLGDSSGHGYDFIDAGFAGFGTPTSSTDVPTGPSVTGSAQFNGTSSFTKTALPILMNSYNAVRFSYWVKVETATDQIMLLENSWDTNAKVNTGSTFHLFNYNGAGLLTAYRTNGIGFPSEATTLDYDKYNTLDEWHFVQVDYDFGSQLPTTASRFKLTVSRVARFAQFLASPRTSGTISATTISMWAGAANSAAIPTSYSPARSLIFS